MAQEPQNAPSYRNISNVGGSARIQLTEDFKIRRPFPGPSGTRFDPFLMLDHFGPREILPGVQESVPPHPHRGFEPVTILFEGAIRHEDSMGNASTVEGGGVQWMTAGSGVVHAEYISAREKQKGGHIHGVQLWVNLPKKDKMTTPGYQLVQAADIPVTEAEKGRVRVIAGNYAGVKGPIRTFTPVEVWDVRLEEGGSMKAPLPENFTAVAYVVEGSASLNGAHAVRPGTLVTFDKLGLPAHTVGRCHPFFGIGRSPA